LAHSKTESDSHNKKQAESKKIVKELIGRSPDRFDCCILTFAKYKKLEDEIIDKIHADNKGNRLAWPEHNKKPDTSNKTMYGRPVKDIVGY